ncbi:MAG: prepilin-type N-terminal cleavage/methylation domain-containing protein [Chthoniobacterales bacterium]
MPRLLPLNNFKVARARSLRGFTLVELLVAVAIVAFLIVVLSQIIISAQAIWRHSEARTDAFRDARAALELMSRDLAFALTDNRAPVLALTNLFSQSDDASAGPTHNQQVFALIPMRNTGEPTPSPTPTRTDICAVGFYCSWDPNRRAYVLRRHVVQSNPTFTRLQAAFGAPTATPSPSPSPAPTGPPIAPSEVFSPSNPTAAPSEDEDVAAYVWDLKVTAYENIAGVLTAQNYPIIYRSTPPQLVKISFKAFSPQAARQLEAQNIGPEVWFETTSVIYKNQIAPHVQEFSTLVKLENARQP